MKQISYPTVWWRETSMRKQIFIYYSISFVAGTSPVTICLSLWSYQPFAHPVTLSGKTNWNFSRSTYRCRMTAIYIHLLCATNRPWQVYVSDQDEHLNSVVRLLLAEKHFGVSDETCISGKETVPSSKTFQAAPRARISRWSKNVIIVNVLTRIAHIVR